MGEIIDRTCPAGNLCSWSAETFVSCGATEAHLSQLAVAENLCSRAVSGRVAQASVFEPRTGWGRFSYKLASAQLDSAIRLGETDEGAQHLADARAAFAIAARTDTPTMEESFKARLVIACWPFFASRQQRTAFADGDFSVARRNLATVSRKAEALNLDRPKRRAMVLRIAAFHLLLRDGIAFLPAIARESDSTYMPALNHSGYVYSAPSMKQAVVRMSSAPTKAPVKSVKMLDILQAAGYQESNITGLRLAEALHNEATAAAVAEHEEHILDKCTAAFKRLLGLPVAAS